jgi:hypothetical protein
LHKFEANTTMIDVREFRRVATRYGTLLASMMGFGNSTLSPSGSGVRKSQQRRREAR